MEFVKQNSSTLLLAIALMLGAFALTSAVFDPAVRQAEVEFHLKKRELFDAKRLIENREAYETQWEKEKPFLFPSRQPEEALNAWVKDLLNLSQTEAITFTQLEPRGLQQGQGINHLGMQLQFHGDIRKLIRCLYHWAEKDHFLKIESLLIKKDNDSKNFSYELSLAKPIL